MMFVALKRMGFCPNLVSTPRRPRPLHILKRYARGLNRAFPTGVIPNEWEILSIVFKMRHVIGRESVWKLDFCGILLLWPRR